MKISKQMVCSLFVLLLVIFISCSEQSENESISFKYGKQDKEIRLNFAKVESVAKERVWYSAELQSKFKLGGIENDQFSTPSQIKIDDSGNMYVLDNKDCAVKVFDNKGNFITKYGRPGRGPGEFQNAFDFDIIDNERVAIICPNSNKFAVFDGSEITEFTPTQQAGNLCFTSKDEVMLFTLLDPYTPLRKVNYKTNSIEGSFCILDTASLHGQNYGMLPFLIGDVHRIGSNKFIYVSQIMGYVVLYDEVGKITNAFKLIDDTDNTRFTKEEKRIAGSKNLFVSFPAKSDYIFFRSNVYDEYLFILNNQVKMNTDEYCIDIYSLSDCVYNYSLRLRDIGEVLSIYLTNQRIYVIRTDTEIEVYDYEIVEE